MPDLPAVATSAFMSRFTESHLKLLVEHMDDVIEKVNTISPNYWPLATFHPFPNYLCFRGKLIGIRVRRKSALEIFWSELKAGRYGKKVSYAIELAGRRSDCGNCCDNCKRTI